MYKAHEIIFNFTKFYQITLINSAKIFTSIILLMILLEYIKFMLI